MRTKLTLLMIPIVALAACGGDEANGDGQADLPGEPVCISAEQSDAPEFVGLNEEAAMDLAADRNLQVREVGRDGECFPMTMDLRDDRINLEFVDDVVVAAGIF